MRPTLFGVSASPKGPPGFSNTKSVEYDGSTEYCTYNTPDPQLITVSAWARTVDATPQQDIVSRTIGLNSYVLGVTTDTAFFGVYTNNSTGHFAQSGAVVSDNTWHHIAGVYDGTDALVYVDGVFGGSVSAPATRQVDTGGGNVGHIAGGSYWNGYIDELAIFDVGLNLTEVQEIYNSGTPTDLSTHSRQADLVDWWRKGDGDTYPTLANAVRAGGGSFDLTMTNMLPANIVSVVP